MISQANITKGISDVKARFLASDLILSQETAQPVLLEKLDANHDDRWGMGRGFQASIIRRYEFRRIRDMINNLIDRRKGILFLGINAHAINPNHISLHLVVARHFMRTDQYCDREM